MTGRLDLRTRQIRWSWRGQTVTLGLDEAGEGPAILLLPALSSISTRREMHPLMHRLKSNFHVIAPDWPGFGDQPRPAVTWTPDALSAFLDHLVTRELPTLHGTIAAGHAAAYALHFAAQQQRKLGRLALLAPTWRGPLPTMSGGDRRVFHTIRHAIGLPVVGALLYQINVNRFVVRMMVAGHVYRGTETLTGDRLMQKRAVIRASGARYGSAAFVTGGLDRVADRGEFLELVRRAGNPLLVVYGAETPRKSRDEIKALAAVTGIQSVITPLGKLGFYEEFAEEIIPDIEHYLS